MIAKISSSQAEWAYGKISEHIQTHMRITIVPWDELPLTLKQSAKQGVKKFVNLMLMDIKGSSAYYSTRLVIPYGTGDVGAKFAFISAVKDTDEWSVLLSQGKLLSGSRFSESRPVRIPSLRIDLSSIPIADDFKITRFPVVSGKFTGRRWAATTKRLQAHDATAYELYAGIAKQIETLHGVSLPLLNDQRITSEELHDLLLCLNRSLPTVSIPTQGLFNTLTFHVTVKGYKVVQSNTQRAWNESHALALETTNTVPAPERIRPPAFLPEKVLGQLNRMSLLRERLSDKVFVEEDRYRIQRIDNELQMLNQLMASYVEVTGTKQLPAEVQKILDLTERELEQFTGDYQSSIERQFTEHLIFLESRQTN